MTSDTRDCLISAAERLFAEQGIDAVSLREINRASGARNSIAVQYHFGDRAGVVRAILDKHRPDVDARRHAMLDQIEADGTRDLRTLCAALVRPLASKLSDPNGGAEFLTIYAELFKPRPLVEPYPATDPRDSIVRWRSIVEPLLSDEANRMRLSFTAIRFAANELGRRETLGIRPMSDRVFTSRLIDLVAGIIAAPVSRETLRLADTDDAKARRPARGRR